MRPSARMSASVPLSTRNPSSVSFTRSISSCCAATGGVELAAVFAQLRLDVREPEHVVQCGLVGDANEGAVRGAQLVLDDGEPPRRGARAQLALVLFAPRGAPEGDAELLG